MNNVLETPPSPSNLISSLCSIGYDLNSAIADIVDNSVAAEARNIWIDLKKKEDGAISIKIQDDGKGMSRSELLNAMRFASFDPWQPRNAKDLGKFGLGLKTASLSQSDRLIVRSRAEGGDFSFEWNLGLVREKDRWDLIEHSRVPEDLNFHEKISGHGTIVLWPDVRELTKKGEKELKNDFGALKKHLSLTFHRFIEDQDVTIWFQGRKLVPINPFNSNDLSLLKRCPKINWPSLPAPAVVSAETYLLSPNMLRGNINFSEEELYDMQGVYFYRSKRLISYGGWLGIRTMPKSKETSLVRVKVDFSSKDEKDWVLDIRKRRASPPEEIKKWLSDYLRTARADAEALFENAKANSLPLEQGVWRRERGAPEKIDTSHPFVSKMLNLVESGLDKETMEGLLNLLAVCFPSNLKKRKSEKISDPEKKALRLLISQMVMGETSEGDWRKLSPFKYYPETVETLLKESK